MAVLWSKQIKELVGEVLSTSMKDTIVVSIPVVKMHPIYKKRYTQYKKCYAHIDSTTQECSVGEKVKIKQSKPLSKTKRWLFVEKVS